MTRTKRSVLWILFVASLIVLFILILDTINEAPVQDEPVAKTEDVMLFFGNTKNDPEVLNCDRTYGTSRQISFGTDKYLAAIAELLQGPNEAEENLGFFTAINPNIALPQITFSDGLLTINFASDFETAMGGSCRVATVRSQITNTFKQFPEVREVLIAVDGRTDDVLQP